MSLSGHTKYGHIYEYMLYLWIYEICMIFSLFLTLFLFSSDFQFIMTGKVIYIYVCNMDVERNIMGPIAEANQKGRNHL